MPVSVLKLFLTVPWVSLQCVIVVFLDHTPLLFGIQQQDLASFQKVSENDQDIPQSHTADQPRAP